MSGNELSSELPLVRMSEADYFNACTPRPGKSPKTSDVVKSVSLKWGEQRKMDKVSCHFATSHVVQTAIRDLRTTHAGLPEKDALFLANTIQRNYVWMRQSRLSSEQFESFVEGVREDIAKCKMDIQLEKNPIKKQRLNDKLTHLQGLETQQKGVFVTLIPSSKEMFRDVLSPSTIHRPVKSIDLLMKAISKDVVEFLTSPDKLENRKRVIEQIWASKPK